MQGVLGGVPAGAGIGAAADPTQQPVPGSFYVFAFLLVALIVLVLSFLRHLRRVQENLGPAQEVAPDAPPATDPDPGTDGR
ncbi:MAG TPA: hypothetical protein VF143_03845 [Candidatus Nanopelagicales bacterium]